MKHLINFGKKNIITFSDEGSKIISDFKPYFYIEDPNGKFKSIFGKKLRKIECDNPKEVSVKRDKFHEKGVNTYESKIRYLQRYLIDRVPTPFPKQKFHKLYLDIETNYSVDVENTPEPIISIFCYSNKDKVYRGWVWRNDIEKKITSNVMYFDNEEEMMNDFMNYIKYIKPDVFLGWNVVFDLGYIINRCKKIKVDYTKLSSVGNVYISKRFGDPKIEGGIIFDLLKVWRILSPNKLESKALGIVASKILNIEKIDIDKKSFWDDIPKLLEYNKRDVELCVKIDEQEELFDFYDERRREFGVLWDSLYYTSGVHDANALRLAKKMNIVLPAVKENKRGKHPGALHFNSDPGLYEYILCFDFKSLYPSIICQFDMSIETVGKEGIQLPNGVTFSNIKKGFLIYLLEGYFEKRKYYKDLMLKYDVGTPEYKKYFMKQYNYKIALNSVFGFIGYERSRFFNNDIFKSILYMGRKLMNLMKHIVEKEFNLKVVYGSTDSVFVESNVKGLKENKELGKKIAERINNEVDEWVKQFGCEKNEYLKLEFERINKTMYFQINETMFKAGKLISSGNRYGYNCIWDNGKECDFIDFTGLEIIRVDNAKITQDIQKTILEMLLKGNVKKEEIDKYVKDIKDKLIKGEYPWQYIGVPKGINKKKYKTKGANVKSAEWSNENLDKKYTVGDRFLMIYGHIKGLPKTPYFAFNRDSDLDGKNVEVNWAKMFDLLIDSKISKIYQSLGWTVDKSKKKIDVNQKSLSMFC